MIRHFLIAAALLPLLSPSLVRGDDKPARVYVVTGAEAPELERFAAGELAGQFQRLFDVEVVAGTAIPGEARHVVLIGSPATNPAIGQALGKNWPELSAQGLLLKSLSAENRETLVVGGNTPRATLWAVYELGHRYGIRYLLRQDIFPLKKQPLKLTGIDVALEPQLHRRAWVTSSDTMLGAGSWGVADHARFLDQLAKLKFNRMLLEMSAGQPFVDYEVGGVKKQSAELWRRPQEHVRVDGETVGRKAFGGAAFFESPDFAGKAGYEDLTAAGIRHARGIIAAARKRGMQVGISIPLMEFPAEFRPVLPDSHKAGHGGDTVLVGYAQGDRRRAAKQAVATRIRAYLTTYPEIDSICLNVRPTNAGSANVEEAWSRIAGEGSAGRLTFAQFIARARERKLIADDANEKSLKSAVVALALLHGVLDDKSLLTRPDGSRVRLMVAPAATGLCGVLDELLPAGVTTLHGDRLSPRRNAAQREALARVPAQDVPAQLRLPLDEFSACGLPQSSLSVIEQQVNWLKQRGWGGFSASCSVLGELDTSIHFLSRAAWQEKLTTKAAFDDLWVTTTGDKSAASRLWLGTRHVEQATDVIHEHDLQFAAPDGSMLTRHLQGETIPEWWKTASDHYSQSMIEMYRARSTIDERTRDLLFYYAKRGEYPLSYFAAVTAVREAGIAKRKGETEQAIEHMGTAVESMYNGINTLADVARGQTDRGLVAALNEYAYRPLMKEFEKLLEEE